MKIYSHQELSELRKTLEYAEAACLMRQQRELDHHRSAIKKQLSALKRLSRAAFDAAQSDTFSKSVDPAIAAVCPGAPAEN